MDMYGYWCAFLRVKSLKLCGADSLDLLNSVDLNRLSRHIS